jgi:pimeloyl-ACP methyl ester carboxylesterase
LAIGCPAVLATAPATAAGAPRGPGLTVSTGSVSATGAKLKGSATVDDSGPAVSSRFYVTLIVRLPGPDRLVKRTHLNALAHGASKTIGFSARVPAGLPVGRHPIWACVSKSNALPVPSARNGCRSVGTIAVPAPHSSPSAGGPAHAEAPPPPALPLSTVPTDPIPFEVESPFPLADAQGNYWIDVPMSYDRSHQTPTKLLVWLHGCGGYSEGDIYTVSPEARDWISIAVGGREGECWDPNGDQPKVTAAIADVETHFNIDRHRVVLGGYSSGGDLSYRLAFYDADQFAGVLAENTSPFRDTGSTESASLAAAAWKFNVIHLAHLEDTEYPIQGVREETDAMIAAGFPLRRIEVEGDHYDNEGELVNGDPVPGTDADLINYLLPYMDAGWRSP